jgi:predicted esterase
VQFCNHPGRREIKGNKRIARQKQSDRLLLVLEGDGDNEAGLVSTRVNHVLPNAHVLAHRTPQCEKEISALALKRPHLQGGIDHH